MSNVIQVPLMEICNPKQWPTISQTAFTGNGYPVYGANGRIGFYSEFNHEHPTILITCRGATCGTIKVCEPKSYVTGNAMALDDLDLKRANLSFVVHALRHHGVSKAITGTAQPQITRQSLSVITVPLPSLPEQRRIADILDKADAIRRKRRASRDIVECLPLSLFYHAFGADFQLSNRPTALSEVAEVVSGVTKGRRFNGSATRVVPYLRVANVQDGFLNLDEIKTIEALEIEVPKLSLRHGDVVMTEGGDFDKLGRGALWEHNVPDCIHQNHVFRVRVNRDYLLPEYFNVFLRTIKAKAYFLSCAKKTSNLASINITQLKALPVPLPKLELQNRFVCELRQSQQLNKRSATHANDADHLFNSLVQQAFRGDL